MDAWQVIVKGFHELDLVDDTYDIYAHDKLGTYAGDKENLLSFLCLAQAAETTTADIGEEGQPAPAMAVLETTVTSPYPSSWGGFFYGRSPYCKWSIRPSFFNGRNDEHYHAMHLRGDALEKAKLLALCLTDGVIIKNADGSYAERPGLDALVNYTYDMVGGAGKRPRDGKRGQSIKHFQEAQLKAGQTIIVESARAETPPPAQCLPV